MIEKLTIGKCTIGNLWKYLYKIMFNKIKSKKHDFNLLENLLPTVICQLPTELR
jgi:hypothetical protein